MAASAPALAHPHVWVGTQTKIIFENGALSGLRYTWLFDEMYTANAIEGLDKNKDGKFEAAELEELTKVNIEGLKEFDYFTAATMAGEALQFGDAKDYTMEVIDGRRGPRTADGGRPRDSTAADAPTRRAPRPVVELYRLGRRPVRPLARTPLGQRHRQAAPPPPEKTKVLALHHDASLEDAVARRPLEAGAKGFQFSLNDAPDVHLVRADCRRTASRWRPARRRAAARCSSSRRWTSSRRSCRRRSAASAAAR